MLIIVVTGGFDPIHSGHIEYFRAAKRLGDRLCVGVNSDAWLRRKKGFRFMPLEERKAIIESLKYVDHVFDFDDSDDTACNAIERMMCAWPFHNIVFANGGDRTENNIPELKLEKKYTRLKFAFGIGGDNKKNSSSKILKDFADYTLLTNKPRDTQTDVQYRKFEQQKTNLEGCLVCGKIPAKDNDAATKGLQSPSYRRRSIASELEAAYDVPFTDW